MVLNGTEVQTVTFENGRGGFCILELGQEISQYVFYPDSCWEQLITIEIEDGTDPVPDKEFYFTDIEKKPGSWKYDSVKYVNDRGIMGSVGGSSQFQPDQPLTRAMFATVLYRMAREPEVIYSSRFSDVSVGKWYSNAILWAAEEQIVGGYGDGSYGINDNITREQIAKMLCLYGDIRGYDVSARAALDSFTDQGQVSGWSVGFLQWAVDAGMISGKPNGDGSYRLDPKGPATRAECAKMLMMFLQKYEG